MFNELAAAIKNSHVYVQTHDFPDPDAIASAYGMQRLLQTKGIESTICYSGNIDRYSTAKLIEQLGIEMISLEDLYEIGDIREEDEVVLVDSQKGNSNIVDMVGDEIACIDHHPVSDNGFSYRYLDIRPEYGACATMIVEYFLENNVEIDRNLATAFTYAIRIDTAGLLRGVSKRDIEVLAMLYDKTDYEMIHRLENSVIYRNDLDVYADAIENIKVFDNVSFAYVGANCPETLIAQICDFMLELVEVEFSVVYSLKRNGMKISIRSIKNNLDAGVIVRKALRGIGNGGGHAAMAGGFVPFHDGIEDADTIGDEIRKRFINVLHLGSGLL